MGTTTLLIGRRASRTPFVSKGTVTVSGITRPVNILRDSGALHTLLRTWVATGKKTGKWVILSSNWEPLVLVHQNLDCLVGDAPVTVLQKLPIPGVDFNLGNDLAGERIGGAPPPVMQ